MVGELLEQASGPVRTPTAATWRESTSAVSRIDSPAGQLHLVGAQDHRLAAELDDADLKGQARARRGLLEDERHAAARQRARECGAAFSSAARASSPSSSAAVSSVPVRNWRGIGAE